MNALIALAAAALWGGGDFCGGMGVKQAGGSTKAALRFVVLSHCISFTVLLVILAVLRRPVPLGAPALWAVAGGVAGGVGLTAFYIALSRGAMGAAAAAIWMIAAGDSPENQDSSTASLALAAFGGAAFGLYFVALRMANPLGLVAPMAIARCGSLAVCGLLLGAMAVWSSRDERQTQRTLRTPRFAKVIWPLLPWALGVALMDTGGNIMFVAATRLGRLDVAAVLASLYPAGTILLAAWHLHERPTRRQVAGMAAALAAVVMIAA